MNMTDKVTILESAPLPIPRIAFREPSDLAAWYRDQLDREYGEGQRQLSIACFPAEALGFEENQAAYVVLRAATEFLYDYEEVTGLTILCGGPQVYRAYSLNWNMWYAAYKPRHDDEA